MTTMKINWGHKLILVFMVFGTMMSYLVYRCMKTTNDMVSKEYYKDELVYQQVIDDANRASQLSSKIRIVQDEAAIIIHFPSEMKAMAVNGYAWFYCAADARKDRRIKLSLDADGIQQVDAHQFLTGKYIVKINWSGSGKDYYTEAPFSIH